MRMAPFTLLGTIGGLGPVERGGGPYMTLELETDLGTQGPHHRANASSHKSALSSAASLPEALAVSWTAGPDATDPTTGPSERAVEKCLCFSKAPDTRAVAMGVVESRPEKLTTMLRDRATIFSSLIVEYAGRVEGPISASRCVESGGE